MINFDFISKAKEVYYPFSHNDFNTVFWVFSNLEKLIMTDVYMPENLLDIEEVKKGINIDYQIDNITHLINNMQLKPKTTISIDLADFIENPEKKAKTLSEKTVWEEIAVTIDGLGGKILNKEKFLTGHKITIDIPKFSNQERVIENGKLRLNDCIMYLEERKTIEIILLPLHTKSLSRNMSEYLGSIDPDVIFLKGCPGRLTNEENFISITIGNRSSKDQHILVTSTAAKRLFGQNIVNSFKKSNALKDIGETSKRNIKKNPFDKKILQFKLCHLNHGLNEEMKFYCSTTEECQKIYEHNNLNVKYDRERFRKKEEWKKKRKEVEEVEKDNLIKLQKEPQKRSAYINSIEEDQVKKQIVQDGIEFDGAEENCLFSIFGALD